MSLHQEIDDEHENIVNEINGIHRYIDPIEPQILEVDISSKNHSRGIMGSSNQQSNQEKSKSRSKKKKKEKDSISPSLTSEEIPSNESLNADLNHPPQSSNHPPIENEISFKDGVIIQQNRNKDKDKEEKRQEMKKLIQKIEKVEEKLKDRVQYQIIVCNITVTKLIRVHKLMRNRPWIKASYGTEHEWIAEYSPPSEEGEEDEDDEEIDLAVTASERLDKKKAVREGSMATWNALYWSFNLGRNESNRNDLVFAVCSKDFVIGRYVVRRDEFKDIPESNSGFFSITGDVTNSLGKVGSISIICQKMLAERPSEIKNAKKKENKSKLENSETDVSENSREIVNETNPELAIPETENEENKPVRILDSWQYQYISLRVLSIAVMDLRSVHFLEANSPSVIIESGEWMGMTDPMKNAGLAASWRKLQWKIAVDRDGGIAIFVNSYVKLIGKVYISAEELLTMQPAESRSILPVIKYITHGKEIAGKIKLNMIINHPDDIIEAPLVRPSVSTPKDMSSTDIDEQSNPAQPSPTTVEGKIGRPQKYFRSIPFNVIIQEIVCLDIAFPFFQKLFQSLLVKVHVACSAWSSYTDEIEAKGQHAHWINLRWKIPVMNAQTALRSTLWYANGKLNLGSSLLSVDELLQTPTDRTGRAELFTKIINEKGEICGKLRISCRFEENLSAIKKLVEVNENVATSGKINQSPLKTISKALSGDSAFQSDFTFSNNRSLLFPDDKPQVLANVINTGGGAGQGGNLPSQTPQRFFPVKLEFPIHGMITCISVIDLISVHRWKKNSPQVDFAYDRASISTEIAANSGSTARWEELNWTIKVREDSVLRFTVKSNQTTIGLVQLKPRYLISLPVNPSGGMEIVLDIFSSSSNNSVVSGKLIINFQVNVDLQRQKQYQDTITKEEKGSSAVFATMPTTGITEQAAFDLQSSTFQPTLSADMKRPDSAFGSPMLSSFPGDFGTSPSFLDQHFQPTVVFDPNVLYTNESQKNYSFRVRIDEIDLWDLKAVHSLTKNSPQVFAACGKWSTNTAIGVNAGSQCFWTNLQWNFVVSERSSRLQIKVISKSKELGTVYYSVAQLMEANTEDDMVKRITSSIVTNGEDCGRLKITFRMEALRAGRALDIANNPNSGASNFDMRRAISKDMQETGSTALSFSRNVLSTQSARNPVLFHSPSSSSAFPCVITLLQINIFDFMLRQQSILASITLRLRCEGFYQSIESELEEGGAAIFRSLNWQIPITSGDTGLQLLILQRGEEIAHLHTKSSSLLSQSRSVDGSEVQEIVFPLQSVSSNIELGQIALIFKSNNAGKAQIKRSLSTSREGMISNRNESLNSFGGNNPIIESNRVFPPLGMSHSAPSFSRPAQFQQSSPTFPPGNIDTVSFTLPTIQNQNHQNNGGNSVNASVLTTDNSIGYASDTIEAAIKFTILAIAAIDLPAVHRFKSNSPVCSLACGKFTTSTEIAANSGSTATWENLKMQFSCNRTAQVRILITSADQMIGTCNLPRSKLLNAIKTDLGFYMIYGDLRSNTGNAAGKIKLVYEMQLPGEQSLTIN